MLALVAVSLVALHIAFEVLHHVHDRAVVHDLQRRVSVDEEASIPALFSSLLLLSCAALLGVIARAPATAHRTPWAVLAGVFVFLAIDEAAALHEALMEVMRPRTGGSGVFYFVWVVPYGAATALLAATFLPFLLSLPRRSGGLFVLAGGIFVLGALGFEMLAGPVAEASGYETFTYTALSTTEESLETAGTIIFVAALLDYIGRELQGAVIRIAPGVPALAAAEHRATTSETARTAGGGTPPEPRLSLD